MNLKHRRCVMITLLFSAMVCVAFYCRVAMFCRYKNLPETFQLSFGQCKTVKNVGVSSFLFV